MSVKLVNKIKESGWRVVNPGASPFLEYDFFLALEESKSVGVDSGWEPLYLTEGSQSLMYSFIKNHSYGEYIFDWDWANFYHKYGEHYYPKLTSMVPFTSATTPHFLGFRSTELMREYEEFYEKNDFSSSHFLFLQEEEIEFFKSFQYLIRESFQYHFFNKDYRDFNDFLSSLKSKKAKQIKKERQFPSEIKINRIMGDELTSEHAQEMYEFYCSTIQNKNALSYLKKEFFNFIFDKLKNCILYVQAIKNNSPIAGALYFYNTKRLYGRYWGSCEEVPNLHFELCYYQGIEFCLENKLAVFEAGAQGEHKIARGFRPVKTFSAHKFKLPQFHSAIAKYIQDEKSHVKYLRDELSKKLPFKVG